MLFKVTVFAASWYYWTASSSYFDRCKSWRRCGIGNIFNSLYIQIQASSRSHMETESITLAKLFPERHCLPKTLGQGCSRNLNLDLGHLRDGRTCENRICWTSWPDSPCVHSALTFYITSTMINDHSSMPTAAIATAIYNISSWKTDAKNCLQSPTVALCNALLSIQISWIFIFHVSIFPSFSTSMGFVKILGGDGVKLVIEIYTTKTSESEIYLLYKSLMCLKCMGFWWKHGMGYGVWESYGIWCLRTGMPVVDRGKKVITDYWVSNLGSWDWIFLLIVPISGYDLATTHALWPVRPQSAL